MFIYINIFILIFTINVIPFFMPATWTVVSFLKVLYGLPIFTLAIIGAIAATFGRYVLLKLSRILIREKILSEHVKENLDDIKIHIDDHRGITIGSLIFYSLSPFPSNYLFMAYGLTNLEPWLIIVPFFIGRLISYGFWAFSINWATYKFSSHISGKIFGIYFLTTQILLIGAVYVFTKINWHRLFTEKKLSFIK